MSRLLPLLLTTLLTLPLFASSEWVNVDSKLFGGARSVLVDLPDSYVTGGRRYPVVYVLDGTIHAFHTAATAKALSDNGRMPEVIVVGVRHDDRVRELTPTEVAQATVDGDLVRFPNSGGAAKTLAFLETELIPDIEKRYRTEPFRILSGHSFGGMFALDAFFTNPKLFNTVIATSPTVWWDNKYLTRRALQFVEKAGDVKGTVVLAVGKEFPAMNDNIKELETVLARAKGLTVHSYYLEEEDHFSTAVPGTYSALRKIFAPWYLKIDSSGDVTTLWPRAQAHAQELSKQYGYRIAVPEERANSIGYILLRAKRNDKALEVFQANVTTYAGSANAHDSLGDAYAATGDNQRAWQNYERAVQLARTTKHPLKDAFESKLADFKRRNPMMFPPQIRR